MADGTVDSLNLQISADATSAAKSVNTLVRSLKSMDGAFSKNVSNMRKFSKELGTLSTAMKSLSKIKFSVPDMSGMNKMLKSLNKLNPDGAQETAKGIEKVVSSFNKLGSTNFNDSGVNKTVNALNRLLKVDTSKFNPADFERITDAITNLGTIPDVSSGVNRFVSSLSRLANAGEKTGQSANGVLKLGQQTRLAAQELQSVGAINDDVNLFVQSIGRLASAGGKTGQTASGLSALSKETLDFFRAMQTAPKISENTIRMTQALAQLASAGGKVGTATNKITSSFQKLSSIGTSTLSAINKVSSGIVSAFKQIGNSSGSITKAQFSLSNLLKTAVGFRLGYGLLNFGKQAFELGSDITEVENVVDVAFGSMADSAYDFAKTAQEQFGLSELSALRYSGILMSMFNASGIAQKQAAEMSTTLTGLAGDIASFYNIDQEEAFTKLRSALAGEVEPMRALGVDMTVASLEAYALSQGITESYQSMSQAEKVMLRYNYLMSATAAQQGDFARTSGSFANQLRLLTLNIQQLAATIGQGLIAAVLPAVTALNKLFSVLQKAAVAVRNFFYVLTGYKGGGSSGIVNDLSEIGDATTGVEDLGSAGTDAADGLGEAAKAAEELKNATLGIDELNIISPNEPASSGTTGSSGASGGGTGGVGGADLGLDDSLLDLGDKEPEKYVSPWAQRIRDAFLAEDWEQLGFEIADGLNHGLQKVYDVLNWENVGPKITAFTTAFTETFNSFANSFDFDLLGRTIGTGINTVVNTLNQLIDGIDWVNLGERFATGFNGLVDEVDWFELGRLIGNKFMIAWDTLLGFVTALDWGEVGRSLANGFNGMLQEISLGDIGTTIGTTVAGIIEMFREFFANADWVELANQVKEGIKNALVSASDEGENNGILAGIFGVGAIAGISKAIEPLSGIMSVLGNNVSRVSSLIGKSGLGKAFSTAEEASGKSGLWGALSGLKGVIGAISSPIAIAVGAITLFVAGIIDLWNTSETFRDNVKEMWDRIADAFSYAKTTIWDETLVPLWDDIKDLFDSLYDAYESSGTKDMFEDIVTFLGDILSSGISVFIKTVSNAFKTAGGVLSGVIEILAGIVDFVSGTFSGDWSKAWSGIKKIVKGIVDGIASFFSGLWDTIKTIFSPVAEFFKDVFSSAKDRVTEAWKSVSSWFKEKWDSIKNTFSKAPENFKDWFSRGYTNVKNAFSPITSWFKEKWKSVKNVFSGVKDFFKNGFQKAYNAVKNIWGGLGGFFKGVAENAFKPIKKLVNGIINGVNFVLKKVGSKTRLGEWKGVEFAKGTDGLPKDTLAVVNDQKGSTYKELIVPPNGRPFIPKGRNVTLPLPKGTKIMPAKQTKEFMSKTLNIPHFKNGIGDLFGHTWEKIKNFTGSVWDYLTNPTELVQIAIDKFTDISGMTEPWLSVAKGMTSKVLDGISDFISGIFENLSPVVNYSPSKGVEQWRSVAAQALRMTNQYSESNLNLLLYQMQTESGGNPNAINNWDINAKRGTPSKGLMQVIDPTFQAYKYPGYDNIWDPLSNILASIRYTLSRYGSLANGWKGHGYAEGIGTITISDIFNKIPMLANGGVVMPGQLFVANEKGPELIGRYGNRTAVLQNDQVVSSVSSGVEKAVQRQNIEMTYLLRQILETNQRILAKDNSANIDGKRAGKLIDRAKSNSGYGFRRELSTT